MSQTPNRNDGNGKNKMSRRASITRACKNILRRSQPSSAVAEAQPLMSTTPTLEHTACSDREAQSQTLCRRSRSGSLRAPELTSTIKSTYDDNHNLARSELPTPSNVVEAAGTSSESRHTCTENPSLHTSISGDTLFHTPVSWRSSETLVVPFVAIADPDSGYEAVFEDSLLMQASTSHTRLSSERVQTTKYGISYNVQEINDMRDEGEELLPLDVMEIESNNEALHRTQSESILSLRHPIQLLRHIVIPRRNSRRRRVDLYPSVDSTPRTIAADASQALTAHRDIGDTPSSSDLNDMDQRLSSIPSLLLDEDLADSSRSKALWGVWREPRTIPSSSEDSDSDDIFPTPDSSLQLALSPALNGEDHPLRSNPPRSSADPLLPVSPSSPSDDEDHDGEDGDEENFYALNPLDLPSSTLSLFLTSTPSLESSPAHPSPFASLPAPASTLDASWNAWLASLPPSQISLPESEDSNRSAYFTPSHSPVLSGDYIQQQHRRFLQIYRQDEANSCISLHGSRLNDILTENDGITSGRSESDINEQSLGDEEGNSESESESMRIRERNRRGFYLLGARRRSGDGVGVGGDGNADSRSGNDMGSSSSDSLFGDSLFGDSFLDDMLARGSAFLLEIWEFLIVEGV